MDTDTAHTCTQARACLLICLFSHYKSSVTTRESVWLEASSYFCTVTTDLRVVTITRAYCCGRRMDSCGSQSPGFDNNNSSNNNIGVHLVRDSCVCTSFAKRSRAHKPRVEFAQYQWVFFYLLVTTCKLSCPRTKESSFDLSFTLCCAPLLSSSLC